MKVAILNELYRTMSLNEYGLPELDDQTRIENVNKALKTMSFSKISAFYSCSLFWASNYLYGIRPTTKSVAMARGEELHELYEILSTKSPGDPEYKEALSKFKKRYPGEYMKYENVWKKHRASLPPGPMEYFEMELHAPLSITYNGSPVTVMGYLDYLNVNDPNNSVIIDYKSGSFTKDPRYADQAAIYALLVFNKFKGHVKRIRTYLYDISDSGRDVINENQFEFNYFEDFDQLVDTTSKLASSLINAVQKDRFPATPCNKCGFCPIVKCRFNKNKQLKSNLSQTPAPIVENVSLAENSTAKEKPKPELENLTIAEFFNSTAIGEPEKKILEELRQKMLEAKKAQKEERNGAVKSKTNLYGESSS